MTEPLSSSLIKKTFIISMFLIAIIVIKVKATDLQVHVARCCQNEKIYSFGNSKCIVGLPMGTTWPPPIYNSSSGELIDRERHKFQDLNGTVNCKGNEFVVNNAHNFKLFDDGTLEANNELYSAGQFCVERAAKNEPPSGSDFIARFCIPDPCLSKQCVRKCCPQGYSMSEGERKCIAHATNLKPDVRSENGIPLKTDLIVRAGVKPNCSPSKPQLLDPTVYPNDRFFLLPSGELFIPAHPRGKRKINEYCIDNFFNSSQVDLKGLICFPTNKDTQDRLLSVTIFAYLQIVSAIFLLATFVVYAALPTLRNIHGVTVMSFSFSFSTTYFSLASANLYPNSDRIPCRVLAVIIHFFFTAAFAWLTVMSFDIYWTFCNVIAPTTTIRNGRNRVSKRFVHYSLFGWGLPLAIVIFGQILDNVVDDLPENVIVPGFAVDRCWFNPADKWAIFAYFYGPVALLLSANVIFFILTTVKLCRDSQDSAIATSNNRSKQRLRLIFMLFILMGVTWTLEIISWYVGGSAYDWIVSDIFNILTGVFIFVIFVCKKKVFQQLCQKCRPISCFSTTLWKTRRSVSQSISRSAPTIISNSVTAMISDM